MESDLPHIKFQKTVGVGVVYDSIKVEFPELYSALVGGKLIDNVIIRRFPLESYHLNSLAEGFAKNPHVKRLEILGSDKVVLGDKGVAKIAEILKKSASLEILDLQANGIGVDGVKHLEEALVRNKTLTALSLRENPIGAAGAMSLARALRVNTSLKLLDLDYTNIGARGAEELLAAASPTLRIKLPAAVSVSKSGPDEHPGASDADLVAEFFQRENESANKKKQPNMVLVFAVLAVIAVGAVYFLVL